tara:strand:+ start:432 stop:539 length:108 start_codon:yes stop_codon:yes gene_type:complete
MITGIIWISLFFLISYLIIKRLKLKKEETFEKRDN